MFIGRQVTVVCPQMPPLPRSPTVPNCELYIFSQFSCIFESPLEPPQFTWSPVPDGKVYCCDPKVIFLRDCLNKTMRLWPEQKKRSHSIFVLIYNDIYHFVWSNKMFKKETLTCTIDTTYGLQTLNFRSHTFVSLVQCLHISSLSRHSVLSTFLFGHNISSPAFFFSNLSGRTRQVHNLFKCHTRQKDDGARLLMAK